LGIQGQVKPPKAEHPKRPIQGFDCQRSEVSGSRLWGWVKQHFGTPDAFFAGNFIHNYCPLVFMEAGGKNFTPDKLPVAEREALFAVCDDALRAVVDELEPTWVVGVGAFAQKRAALVLTAHVERGLKIGSVLHPSPASPKANRGWAAQADADLERLGIHWPSGG
jgi:single-strand selective monofunctional uracil DNA glycosylase